MSSKRRVRRRQCSSKLSYPTAEAAHAGQVKHAWSRGERIAPYRCEFCAQFHVGHPNARQRQSKAAKRKRSAA